MITMIDMNDVTCELNNMDDGGCVSPVTVGGLMSYDDAPCDDWDQ